VYLNSNLVTVRKSERSWLDSWNGQEICLISKTSIMARMSTRPSIQPIRQALSSVSKTVGAWRWQSPDPVSRWRINGAIPPLTQLPSWRVGIGATLSWLRLHIFDNLRVYKIKSDINTYIYILELRTLCMRLAVIPQLVQSWSAF
jgi:hypothetical protein